MNLTLRLLRPILGTIVPFLTGFFTVQALKDGFDGLALFTGIGVGLISFYFYMRVNRAIDREADRA